MLLLCDVMQCCDSSVIHCYVLDLFLGVSLVFPDVGDVCKLIRHPSWGGETLINWHRLITMVCCSSPTACANVWFGPGAMLVEAMEPGGSKRTHNVTDRG
jgi:hypothetical protein